MRFSIRQLLILITVVAMLLPPGMYLTRDLRYRAAIRSQLLDRGAFSVRFGPSNSILTSFSQSAPSDDLAIFGKIATLDLQQISLDSESLKPLRGLEQVDTLILNGCQIPDAAALESLTRIAKLKTLLIWSTNLPADAGKVLARIPGLERVDLSKTAIKPAAEADLRRECPHVTISIRP